MSAAFELHGVRILDCGTEGTPPRTAKDATDIIGAAWGYQAKLIVLRADWLGDDFFRLGTRVAGEVVQKLLDYGFRVAIVGDISARVAASEPLRDWVRECNRGRHIWFVKNMEDLADRLAPA
ncbi:MAG: DUF4180 domain-containing protein [Gemmatimonadales bacterium]